MNKELTETVNNLVATILDSANNNSKTPIEKVNKLYYDYKAQKIEIETVEQEIYDNYIENINMQRTNKQVEIDNYLQQRTELYDEYIIDNNKDSLRKLLNFQINAIPNLTKLYDNIKYENVYTKYGNIRMLSYL